MRRQSLQYVIFCVGILCSIESYACVGGGCSWSCLDRDFHVVRHCCKQENADCLAAELSSQRCGEGEFLEYPKEQRECCNASLTECNQKLRKQCVRCHHR